MRVVLKNAENVAIVDEIVADGKMNEIGRAGVLTFDNKSFLYSGLYDNGTLIVFEEAEVVSLESVITPR